MSQAFQKYCLVAISLEITFKLIFKFFFFVKVSWHRQPKVGINSHFNSESQSIPRHTIAYKTVSSTQKEFPVKDIICSLLAVVGLRTNEE